MIGRTVLCGAGAQVLELKKAYLYAWLAARVFLNTKLLFFKLKTHTPKLIIMNINIKQQQQ